MKQLFQAYHGPWHGKSNDTTSEILNISEESIHRICTDAKEKLSPFCFKLRLTNVKQRTHIGKHKSDLVGMKIAV